MLMITAEHRCISLQNSFMCVIIFLKHKINNICIVWISDSQEVDIYNLIITKSEGVVMIYNDIHFIQKWVII